MSANKAIKADRLAGRRVAWRERLIGVAAAVLGRPSAAAQQDWDRGSPVLLYHRVYPDRVPRHDPFGVTRSDLEAQVGWLSDRFELVTVTEMVERLSTSPGAADSTGARMAAITFDDGYQCTYEQAWPVLRDAGIRATLFVDTARLDGPRPALTRDELLAMAEEGMEIGSHTVSHANLTMLAAAQVSRELEESRRQLETLLGRRTLGLAAPYGRYDRATIESARACGYAYMCTCRQHQTNLPRSDPFLVDRLEVNRGDDLVRIEKKLRGEHARVYATWYRLSPVTRHWLTDECPLPPQSFP